MNVPAVRVALGCVFGVAALGAGSAPVSAQTGCHPAYSGCLPYYEYDALNCEDIGWGVYQVYDVNWDPYNLDTLYGPGNGWTCDGIG